MCCVALRVVKRDLTLCGKNLELCFVVCSCVVIVYFVFVICGLTRSVVLWCVVLACIVCELCIKLYVVVARCDRVAMCPVVLPCVVIVFCFVVLCCNVWRGVLCCVMLCCVVFVFVLVL